MHYLAEFERKIFLEFFFSPFLPAHISYRQNMKYEFSEEQKNRRKIDAIRPCRRLRG